MTKRKTWTQRIAAARKAGEFSAEDNASAVNWNTCAMGEAVRYPKTETKALHLIRKNPALDTCGLGIRFLDAVIANDFDAAADALKKIRALVRG